MNKLRPRGFGLVFLGLAFFFNPYFAVVDALPDFIGCLLICAGLSRVAPVHAGMQDARKAFLRLAAVDAIKNIALLMIFGMGSATEQPTALLLAAFGAAAAEMLFLIPAVRHLFDGFLSLAITYDCTELYTAPYGGGSSTERMQRLTVFFLIFREVVCLLPEFTSLTTSSYSDHAFNRIYDHIGVMRGFAFVIVLAVGLVWLVRLLLYYGRLRRAEAITKGVTERYEAYYASHPGFAVERRHAVAFILLFAGSLLLTDFYLDFKNVIPDVLAGVLLMIGALIPAVDKKYRICAAACAGVYAVVSVISSNAAYAFVTNYNAGEIAKDPAASGAYNRMWALSFAEMLIFLVTLAAILWLLRAVVREWAGYRPQHVTAYEWDEKAKKARFESRSLQAMWEEMDIKLIRCFVFGFVSALFSFLYDYIKEMPGKGILHLLEFTWIFDFCGAVAFAVAFGILLSQIYGEIKQRFLYD